MSGTGLAATAARRAASGAPWGEDWQQMVQRSVDKFWVDVMAEAQEVQREAKCPACEIPLARVKKVMKLEDETKDVKDRRMIGGDANYIMTKASELFVQEVTLRANAHVDENNRRTVKRHDIIAAVNQTDIFDFLIDIVPRSVPPLDAQAASN